MKLGNLACDRQAEAGTDQPRGGEGLGEQLSDLRRQADAGVGNGKAERSPIEARGETDLAGGAAFGGLGCVFQQADEKLQDLGAVDGDVRQVGRDVDEESRVRARESLCGELGRGAGHGGDRPGL